MIENISNTKIAQYTYFTMPSAAPQPETSDPYYPTAASDDLTTLYTETYTEKDFEKLVAPTVDQDKVVALSSSGVNVDDIPLNEYEFFVADTKISNDENAIADKIRRLKEHTDGMYKTAMHDDIITINSLYIGSYSQANNTSFVGDSATTEKVLNLNNLPVTAGNTWAAEKLMSIGEDVCATNVAKMQNIYSAVEMMDLPDPDDDASIVEKANEILIKDNKMLYTEMDMQEIVDTLTAVSDTDIEQAIIAGEAITFHSLAARVKAPISHETKGAIHANISRISTTNATTTTNSITTNRTPVTATPNADSTRISPFASSSVSSSDAVTDAGSTNADATTTTNTSPATDSASTTVSQQSNEATKSLVFESNVAAKVKEIRSQINTIRANLTLQAARNISERLPLESTELSKIALELTAQRNKQVETALDNINLDVAHKQATVETLGVVTRMKYNNDASLFIQIQSDEAATLADFDHILSKYEEQALTPQAYLGESINTVKSQIAGVLAANNIEVTPLSIQAATALVANNDEITLDELNSTMIIAAKMTAFFDEMTPEIVASMIKEGINPYTQSIDESLAFAAHKKIPAMQKSVAASIVALEEKGQINESQKQELIGMFQILNSISKNKDAVIGYINKNELSLNMANLQAAVKHATTASTGIDASIDNLFGEIEGFKIAADTAKKRMDTAHISNKKLANLAKIIQNSQLTDLNTPDLASKVSSTIFPFVKAAVKKELGKFTDYDTLPDSFKEKLDVAKHVAPEVIDMLAEKEIPVTINNIYLMHKFINEPKEFSAALAKEEFFPESFEELEQELAAASDQAEETASDAMSNGDTATYDQNRNLHEMTTFLQKLNQTGNSFELPITINGVAKMVNLYINNDTHDQDTLNAAISYDTKNLGTVTANVRIANDTVKYEITTSSDDATNRLQAGDSALVKMIESLGYSVTQAVFTSLAESVTAETSIVADDSLINLVV